MGKVFPAKQNRSIKRTLALQIGLTCWYCGLDLRAMRSHIDHIIPSSAGGSNEIENLALVCEFCNRAKLDFPLGVFLEWLNWIKKQERFPRIKVFDEYFSIEKSEITAHE